VDTDTSQANVTDSQQGPRAGRTRRTFFGVSRPGAQAAVIVVLVLAMVAGIWVAVYKHYIRPRQMKAEASGDAAQYQLEAWKRRGPKGWQKLLEEAALGRPGYSVDVGRPARLKLADADPKVASFLEQKLHADVFNERLSAIWVLSRVGGSNERTTRLLVAELEQVTERSQGIGIIKCAGALDCAAEVVPSVSLAALDSSDANTRKLAAQWLVVFRDEPGTSPDIRARIEESRTNGDLKVRVAFAFYLTRDEPPWAYRTLLEGVDSDDPETALVAASLVTKLGAKGRINRETSTQEEIDTTIVSCRDWLKNKLQEAEQEAAGREQVGEAIICDACGETTSGLVIPRSKAKQYWLCPECGEEQGRPVVYFMCTNPDCNKALVKTKITVPDEEGTATDETRVCPTCGKGDQLTAAPLSLTQVRETAEETGQEAP